MAHEYLNETTDAMFNQRNLNPDSLYIAMLFYEYTLNQPKFRAQRFYFQAKLCERHPAYMHGYFFKRKTELSATVRNKLYTQPT